MREPLQRRPGGCKAAGKVQEFGRLEKRAKTMKSRKTGPSQCGYSGSSGVGEVFIHKE